MKNFRYLFNASLSDCLLYGKITCQSPQSFLPLQRFLRWMHLLREHRKCDVRLHSTFGASVTAGTLAVEEKKDQLLRLVSKKNSWGQYLFR